jgi:hypothetical protein
MLRTVPYEIAALLDPREGLYTGAFEVFAVCGGRLAQADRSAKLITAAAMRSGCCIRGSPGSAALRRDTIATRRAPDRLIEYRGLPAFTTQREMRHARRNESRRAWQRTSEISD